MTISPTRAGQDVTIASTRGAITGIMQSLRGAASDASGVLWKHRSRVGWVAGCGVAVCTFVLARRSLAGRPARAALPVQVAQLPQLPHIPDGQAPNPGLVVAFPVVNEHSALTHAMLEGGAVSHFSTDLLAHLRIRAAYKTRDVVLLHNLTDAARRWQREHNVPDVAFEPLLAPTVAMAMALSPAERRGLEHMSRWEMHDALHVLGTSGVVRTDHAVSTLADVLLRNHPISRWFAQFRGGPVKELRS